MIIRTGKRVPNCLKKYQHSEQIIKAITIDLHNKKKGFYKIFVCNVLLWFYNYTKVLCFDKLYMI